MKNKFGGTYAVLAFWTFASCMLAIGSLHRQLLLERTLEADAYARYYQTQINLDTRLLDSAADTLSVQQSTIRQYQHYIRVLLTRQCDQHPMRFTSWERVKSVFSTHSRTQSR